MAHRVTAFIQTIPTLTMFGSLRNCLASIGTHEFYAELVALPKQNIKCDRHLIMRYARYATPEILLNESLDEAAVGFYLKGLYRLDPLLHLVEEDRVKPVLTFRHLRQDDIDNEFYSEIFRSGAIFDELAIMISTIGGGCIALCFDRDDSEFSSHEVALVSEWHPVLEALHNLHVKMCMLTGLTSLYGRGFVGVASIAGDGRIFYRNDVWSKLALELDESSMLARVFSFPAQSPATFGNGIMHWEYLEFPTEDISGCRVVFFEAKSSGASVIDVSSRLIKFGQMFNLSPREREIVLQMMKGLHNAAIAKRLGLTLGTVKNYKRRLYDKLDITNEREMFPRVIEHIFSEY